MPRINRVDIGNQIYHVLNRANDRMQIFDNNKDYKLFKGKMNKQSLCCLITGGRALSYRTVDLLDIFFSAQGGSKISQKLFEPSSREKQ